MRIAITRPIPESAVAALRGAGHEVTVSPHERPLSPQELLALTEKANGLITMLTDKVDAAFLAARPNVKAIANYAVGYNNIDVAACTARKIRVSNCPEILNDATAETAWMLLLAAARRGPESERHLRTGRWNGWGPQQFVGVPVLGQTLGVIGAGRIGARFAGMSAGFKMKLLYHNRKPSAAMEALGAKLVPLAELLKTADFISLHVPLSAETRHLIGREQFLMMKSTAVLVNTARGPVVDEAALVEALRTKRIFAAGLDVYEQEPTVHPGLLELENAVLLPHIGSATSTARANLADLAVRNLLAMLKGERPPTPINPEVWAS
jgi:lactate dehydrogenase-like 2-hydroxyacid dehydrogenase